LSLTDDYRFLELLEQDFPYWKYLHGFWRTLPNFNPYTASSEPGQDLAGEALALLQTKGQDNLDDMDDEDAFLYDNYDYTQQIVDIQVCFFFFFVFLMMIKTIRMKSTMMPIHSN
jgi:hypothetical protein